LTEYITIGNQEFEICPCCGKPKKPKGAVHPVEGCPVKMLDEMSGESVSHGGTPDKINGIFFGEDSIKGHSHAGGLGDKGGASRFFYCAKSSSKERSRGLEGLVELRRDLTEEQKNWILEELEKAGVCTVL